MSPIEIAKTFLANAKGHPVTTVFAIIAIGLLGAGKVMTEHSIEPWGTFVAGVGASVVIVLGFVARDPKKPDGEA